MYSFYYNNAARLLFTGVVPFCLLMAFNYGIYKAVKGRRSAFGGGGGEGPDKGDLSYIGLYLMSFFQSRMTRKWATCIFCNFFFRLGCCFHLHIGCMREILIERLDENFFGVGAGIQHDAKEYKLENYSSLASPDQRKKVLPVHVRKRRSFPFPPSSASFLCAFGFL